MNKIIIGTVAAAAAAMGLLACDGIGGDRTTETKNMTIESKINAPKLGLFVINPNSAPHNYANMLMKKGDDGLFEATDPISGLGVMMLWQNKTTPVEVIAYAPFRVDCTANRYTGAVAADQSRESDLIASDLVCQKRNVDPAVDLTPGGSIALSLDHRLSKLEVSVAVDQTILGLSPDANPIESIEIRGTKLDYMFDWDQGVLQTTGAAAAVVPFDTSGEVWGGVALYEAILVPQTIGGGQFEVVMSLLGETYTYTLPDALVLNSNTRYNLSITIAADKSVYASIKTADWDSVIDHALVPNVTEQITIDLSKSEIPASVTVDAQNRVFNVSKTGASFSIVFTGDFDKNYEITKDFVRFYIEPQEDTKYKNSSFMIDARQSGFGPPYQVQFRVTNVLFPLTNYVDVTVNVATARED